VAAKVGRRTVYRWLAQPDGKFREVYDEAMEDAIDLVEAEAHRRAVEGTLKPVYQGGEKVGEVREYSDTLLLAILKGRRPEVYRDRREVTGRDGKPLVPQQVVVRYYPESMRPPDQVRELPEPNDEPSV
jgi:hypothetical protein